MPLPIITITDAENGNAQGFSTPQEDVVLGGLIDKYNKMAALVNMADEVATSDVASPGKGIGKMMYKAAEGITTEQMRRVDSNLLKRFGIDVAAYIKNIRDKKKQEGVLEDKGGDIHVNMLAAHRRIIQAMDPKLDAYKRKENIQEATRNLIICSNEIAQIAPLPIGKAAGAAALVTMAVKDALGVRKKEHEVEPGQDMSPEELEARQKAHAVSGEVATTKLGDPNRGGKSVIDPKLLVNTKDLEKKYGRDGLKPIGSAQQEPKSPKSMAKLRELYGDETVAGIKPPAVPKPAVTHSGGPSAGNIKPPPIPKRDQPPVTPTGKSKQPDNQYEAARKNLKPVVVDSNKKGGPSKG